MVLMVAVMVMLVFVRAVSCSLRCYFFLLLFLSFAAVVVEYFSLTIFFLSSLYKKAGIGKRKKPEVKYVVAKKGVGTLNVITL